MDDQGDLSDRQDRPRYAAFHTLPRFGAGAHPLFSAQIGDPHLEMAAPDGAVRPAFAAAVLLRRIPVLWSALDPGSARPGRRARALDATARQRRRHPDHGWAGMAAGPRRKGPQSV